MTWTDDELDWIVVAVDPPMEPWRGQVFVDATGQGNLNPDGSRDE